MGVSGVDELGQALGTSAEAPKRRGNKLEHGSKNEIGERSESKSDADELVYRDSSTFLKVCHCTFNLSVIERIKIK